MSRLIQESMDVEMYEILVMANGCPSTWNALPVFVHKPGQIQRHLTFNYHFIYKDIPANHIEVGINVHNLLSISSNKCLFCADIKHRYWAVNIHPDDRYYFAFHVLGMRSVQPSHMSQIARTLSYTFNELMNIVLGLIPISQTQSLLLNRKTTEDSALFAFYIDDIFEVFKNYQE